MEINAREAQASPLQCRGGANIYSHSVYSPQWGEPHIQPQGTAFRIRPKSELIHFPNNTWQGQSNPAPKTMSREEFIHTQSKQRIGAFTVTVIRKCSMSRYFQFFFCARVSFPQRNLCTRKGFRPNTDLDSWLSSPVIREESSFCYWFPFKASQGGVSPHSGNQPNAQASCYEVGGSLTGRWGLLGSRAHPQVCGPAPGESASTAMLSQTMRSLLRRFSVQRNKLKTLNYFQTWSLIWEI